MRSVIVLCTGNICRSPMAQALLTVELRALSDAPTVSVTSAGLGALVGYPADENAIHLMDDKGIDIRAHCARSFTGKLGLAHDLVLTMSTSQRHHVEANWPLLQGRVYNLGYFDDQEIRDPYRKGENAFLDALEGIEKGVAQWVPIIAR